MADTFFIEGLNTLPEQVQINKENIKTNTADIAKIKDDIGKIKPNAWEERKFILNMGEDGNLDFTTYNPITDTNTPVNIQKAFIDKDTYSITDALNSYSFFASGSLGNDNMVIYAICTDPSNTLFDLYGLDSQKESGVSIVLIGSKDDKGKTSSSLNITSTTIKTNGIKFKYMTIADNNGNAKQINAITDNNEASPDILLTSYAIDNYYLKKSDASSTYATINALKPLQNSYFDADLKPAGLAKIQANATIGSSITLVKDTDFIENIYNNNLGHRTVIFTLYRDDDEEVYISKNIKLDIVNTTDYYSDNDQHHIWFTGLGVIKLGSASASSNNYLCYIAYDTTSTRGLMITPVQKLN